MTYEVNLALMVALVIGLVEVIKRVNLVGNRWLPLIDIALGLGAGYLLVGNDVKQIVIQGLIVGLSAAGLFSGVKNTFESKVVEDSQYEEYDYHEDEVDSEGL